MDSVEIKGTVTLIYGSFLRDLTHSEILTSYQEVFTLNKIIIFNCLFYLITTDRLSIIIFLL